ncbi:MAG: hypothetical protein ACK5DM_01480, partial [Planctomyces sp.]
MKLRFLTCPTIPGSALNRLKTLVFVLLMLCCAAVRSDESVGRTELPKLSEMPLPTAEALLRADLDDR